MTSSSGPRLFVIAGPNGAGKTTYAFGHIRAVAGTAHFVNLDEISRGLSPLDPPSARLRAARVALDMTRSFIASRETFSIETTLAGRTHLRTLALARAHGYEIVLLYFAAASAEVCLARVARRVAEGGHDVPEVDVRRRFTRSLANVPEYARACHLWRLFDVSRPSVKVVAEGRPDCIAMRSDSATLPPTLSAWLDVLPPCGIQQG